MMLLLPYHPSTDSFVFFDDTIGFPERRLAVIQELLRITCPGGFVMIHAWAQEQGDGNIIPYTN